MKPGKVSQSILNRSILKCIETTRNEVAVGPKVGADCAVLSLDEKTELFLTQSKVAPYGKESGRHAVLSVVNNIAAQGGEPVCVSVHALFPLRAREAHMKTLMQEIAYEAKKYHMDIVAGHTEVTDALNRPIVTLTGVGRAKCGTHTCTSALKPNQDLVITKWVGLEGTEIIAREKEEELLERLPKHLLKTAKDFAQLTSIIPEAATAVKSGVSAMHDVSEGGVFGALWEMADSAGVGLTIDLKSLPIKQETIEICEFYHLNPYTLISGGCLLLAADNGYDLVAKLKKENIHATVIGKTTDGNDRIVTNGEENRFLEPPKMDEIYKVLVNGVAE